jgi:hypothetical protein
MALLTTGSIAFTSFNADEDGWSLVSLIDIDPNQNVFFSDGTATSATNISNTESSFQWNTGSSTISAGTVVRFSAIDQTTRGVTVGTFAPVNSANLGLSATSETLYAFLGSSSTAGSTITTPLAAVSTEPTADDPLTLVGLTNGVNAIRLTPSSDFAQFNGSRTNQTSFANYRNIVNNASNWAIEGDGVFDTVVPNTTRFSLASTTAVPEPSDFMGAIVAVFAVAILKRKLTTKKLD